MLQFLVNCGLFFKYFHWISFTLKVSWNNVIVSYYNIKLIFFTWCSNVLPEQPKFILQNNTIQIFMFVFRKKNYLNWVSCKLKKKKKGEWHALQRFKQITPATSFWVTTHQLRKTVSQKVEKERTIRTLWVVHKCQQGKKKKLSSEFFLKTKPSHYVGNRVQNGGPEKNKKKLNVPRFVNCATVGIWRSNCFPSKKNFSTPFRPLRGAKRLLVEVRKWTSPVKSSSNFLFFFLLFFVFSNDWLSPWGIKVCFRSTYCFDSLLTINQ